MVLFTKYMRLGIQRELLLFGRGKYEFLAMIIPI